MMNAVSIVLLVTSLASAGVWSPPPPSPSPSTERSNDDVIIKEGHRVVVVQYDKDGNPNTKVSISPDHESPVDTDNPSEEGGVHHGPKELICDAFGKCRHKIASAFRRAKEEAAEKVHDVEEAAREAKDSVEEKIGKVTEEVLQKTHQAREGIRSKVDSTMDAAKDASRREFRSRQSAGERVKETARDVKAAAESVRSRAMRMEDFRERHLGKHLGLDALSGMLNLVGFAMSFGMCVWVTFVSSYLMASVLPRHMFGQVQSKIYPVYFRGMVCSVSMTLLGHLLSMRKLLVTSQPDALQAYNLLTSFLTLLVNMLYMEPRATKVMMEKMKVEKEEGRGRDLGPETTRKVDGAPPAAETAPHAVDTEEEGGVRDRVRRLNSRLKKLNSCSSMLNVMSLMSLTWHLVYLTQRLSMTC